MNHSGPLPLQAVFVRDANIVSLTSHDFFSVVVPAMLTVFAVFTSFMLFTWVWLRLWMFMLWRCGISDHWVRLTSYLWGLLLTVAAFWLAFGAVGIDFGHLFLGFGLVTIAFSAGCSSTLSNFFSGMWLQTHGLYVNHEKIRLKQYDGLVGTIESMNLLHVVVRPDNVGDARPGQFQADSVLVPNTVFTDSPVEVMWENGKRPDYGMKPARTAPVPYQYGATKRDADLEASVPETRAPAQMTDLGLFAKMRLEEQRRRQKNAPLSVLAQLHA